MSIVENLNNLQKQLNPKGVTLVAVSKTKPVEEIMQAYDAGQRDFGENLVQEMVEKEQQMPKDIRWHLIGHLQRNKVKYIAPFVSMIQSVDSYRLLAEINKRAQQNDRVIDCLLQIKIADEDTKFGMDFADAVEMLMEDKFQELENIRICGLMGIATLTDNPKVIKEEFYELKTFFESIKKSFFRDKDHFKIISMGMSSDYEIAIEKGSNMVRVGSTIFGKRVTKHFKTE
ncbi:MAG TPA: YggS family pyridoxal phosphate-dependent enzyme [Candidatus Sphingobacterium stercoripullorum]|uniref:Pyridoxal phosphate homeostasis protein n=1 Tax=Candidatus Sphingobacterium stercoripullorum TaxID=2838759 RepID=A0A9D1W862_9SPHI|nr:YggS family pyridoxal phosphate-dependent enzyme [Candidatus Sphingobacterium stercoripullorum]HLR51059.1 YggS family pyridoxal phosphate-dependent enzyme [Candidatus Sphingobacterium stercoripullorum]